MKRVIKTATEPQALTEYKARFADAPRPPLWKEFKKTPGKKAVQDQLRADQRGLCAYCENGLIPDDESVEHFMARDVDHARELDWTNLLLCCAGGSRPLPEDVEDAEVRYDPNGMKTCGHAKLGAREVILNPLEITYAPRLFRFRSESGEIQPDATECQRAGVDTALARQTIEVLRLQAGRLNRARLGLLNDLLMELSEEGETEPFSGEREQHLAQIYLPGTGSLPAFFTTVRFGLGEGAEVHLASIGFQG
jgi:uncharacterized protein (TIGR02646 family)